MIEKLSIQDELFECLNGQKEKDQYARRCFRLAKDKLYAFANSSPSYMKANQSNIRSLLSYIQSAYNNSETGFLCSWNTEKLPRLKKAFEELFHRTQERNFNCYLDDARTISCNLKEPFCWCGEPLTEAPIHDIVE